MEGGAMWLSSSIVHRITIFVDPDAGVAEIKPSDEFPWRDDYGQPVILPSMFEQIINGFMDHDKDMTAARASLFSETLRICQNHHEIHGNEEFPKGGWENSPYSLYQRQGMDLIWKLTTQELKDHWFFTFPSREVGKWARCLIVPADDLSRALQRVTISTDSNYAVGIAGSAVVKAISEFNPSTLWKEKKS
jgi:hypothetical protein